MMLVSESSSVARVAGVVMQVVLEVLTHCPVSPGKRESSIESPLATYRVLYSLSSSGQVDAL